MKGFSAIAVFMGLSSAWGQTEVRNVRVHPDQVAQDFEGWGTSLCWWANGAGRWSDDNLDRLIGRLTDPDSGLGYNIFRYNIGGGDQPGHAHMRQFADIPGFKPTESGPYDWTADPYQRKVLQKLVAGRPGLKLEAFANSPPWWMTLSGCSGGNTDGTDNLKPEYFEAFADYLTEVVKRFRETWGITFQTVEPFNEPSARWWTGPNGTQEGCGFRDNQPRMVKLLDRALRTKGLTGTAVSASDENSIADAVAGLGAYDDSALACLSRVNTHSYFGKADRSGFADLASRRGKRSWQSESGPLSWPGGNQMDVSLWMADVIIKDLKEMKVNGWVDWQSLEKGVWGSFTTDYSLQRATPNKRFFMHAQFSRFIRPGSRILDIPEANIVGAYAPATGNLTVVILNPDATEKTYALDMSGFPSPPGTAKVSRTSESEDLVGRPELSGAKGQFEFIATARSITTLQLKVAPVLSTLGGPGKATLKGQLPVLRLEKQGRGGRDVGGRMRKPAGGFEFLW